MIISKKTAYGQPIILACDGRCDKAWGISSRPTIALNPDDLDDFAWLADSELGIAPRDPGTEEGCDRKPLQPVHNKWCFRECERSVSCPVEKFPNIQLPNFSVRKYNKEGESTTPP